MRIHSTEHYDFTSPDTGRVFTVRVDHFEEEMDGDYYDGGADVTVTLPGGDSVSQLLAAHEVTADRIAESMLDLSFFLDY